MALKVFEMCRCCGDFDLPKLIPFFGPGEHQNLMMTIKNVIISCWEIQIAENDGLPQHICPSCFSKFDAYISLRSYCRKMQNPLNTLFRKMTSDQTEKCLVYKKNEEKNEEIMIMEDTNRSLLCYKKKEVEKATNWLKALDIQNNETNEKDFMFKSIEFVAMPTKISKIEEKGNENSVGTCEMNACDERDTMGQSENEKNVDNLQSSEEIMKECYNDKENNEAHTTIIKQTVFQIENDCEVLGEGEISDPEFDEKTISTDDEDYEESDIFQAKTHEENTKITETKLERNPLACKYCCFDIDVSPNDVIYKSMEALDAHINLQHDPSRPYLCQICKKNYTNYSYCKQHIRNAHKDQRTICWICGNIFQFRTIKNHIRRCHTVADFECETCGKKFKNTSPAIFEYHKRWHNKKYEHKCKFCKQVFIQSTHLHTHMLLHTKDFKIKCDKCGKGFPSQHYKAIHMYRIHGDALPVKCLYCSKRFVNYIERSDHMIKIHSHVNKKDEKIKCLKCNKEFRREAGFRKHMKMDCLRENVTKKFTYIPTPKIKKYSCQQCSLRFIKKSALLKHIPLHSNEGRPFQCDVCQLYYKRNSHLDIHKRLKHSNEKPFACDICGKSFALRFSMNEHRRFHKGAV